MKLQPILLMIACSLTQPSISQSTEGGAQVLVALKKEKSNTRAADIMQQLNLKDAGARAAVQTILDERFTTLDLIYSNLHNTMNKANVNLAVDKDLASTRGRAALEEAHSLLNKAYVSFLGKISMYLTWEEIEELKDLLTEGGLQRELDKLLTLLPDLKKVHKLQIVAYLREARENALNAENAFARSEWFIKFSGRANNYLGAAGYDLRKATEALEARTRICK